MSLSFSGNGSISSTNIGLQGNVTVQSEVMVTSLGVGNVTLSGSGVGVQFPATQVASTDVHTLDDYAEGTWTPNQGAGLTVVGAFTSSGYYIKTGRSVTLSGILSGSTSIAVNANGILFTNAPFTSAAGGYWVGSIVNSTNVVSAIQIGPSTTSGLVAGGNLTASTALYFSITYFTAS